MLDPNPAINGADPTPDDSAIVDPIDPTADPAAPAAPADPSDKGEDTTVDPNEGIHPDALDPVDPNDPPPLTEEELKDPTRLQTRMKDLTTKANRAKDLELQNEELLKENESLKSSPKDPEDLEKDPEGYTPEQLAQAKALMDKLGYVPKADLESLNAQVKKLSSDRASENDTRSMNKAIGNYKDDKGDPIVTKKHIHNAMRKWMASDDPLVRKRIEMDYDAMIQLIGGSKLNKVVSKKTPAPKIPAGGGNPKYQPEIPVDSYDPGNPIGSEQKMLARILKSFD